MATASVTLALAFPIPELALAQAAPETSSGNPLSSIFGCESPGGKQAGGAVIGGLLSGVVGNKVAGKDRTPGRRWAPPSP